MMNNHSGNNMNGNDDNMTEATIDMFPIELEGAEASFPAAEEVRSSMTHMRRSRSKANKYLLWAFGGIALLILLVIIPAVAVSKRDSSSSKSFVPPRPDLNSLIDYLVGQGVSDASDLQDTTTPQYKAARWLAVEDGANIPIPANGITLVGGYRYIFRYVMALNYFALGGDEWDDSFNFLTDDDICYWHNYQLAGGVFCFVGDQPVPRLFLLNANNIVGSLPKENGKLVSLYSLSFQVNSLSGTIPPELCGLSALNRLLLSHNLLDGKIPSCLGKLTGLNQFFLHNNMLEGTIPSALGDLENLEVLFVDDNLLDGNPLQVFNQLTKLELLMANNNNFVGELTETFLANSNNLNWTDMSHNKFSTTDGLPPHLFSLPQLDILDLSHNLLAGNFTLPIDMPENFELQFLSLYENQLTGNLPSALMNLKALDHLDLSSNSFTGPVPDSIGEMTALLFLFLSENPFDRGEVPGNFDQLTNLYEISLRNTNREGPLPAFIGIEKFKDLTLLDLGSNALTGPIPDSYGQQDKLKFLLLNDNEGINGKVPLSFGNLTRLRAAYLDGTSIEGDLDVLCDLPNFSEIVGEEAIYADCGGLSPEVNCTCGCLCCESGLENGCSQPFLSNLDASWENRFRRKEYRFKNGTDVIQTDVLPTE